MRETLEMTAKNKNTYESMLVISTRITFSLELKKWFKGFAHYQALGITFLEPQLITQYESLHHRTSRSKAVRCHCFRRVALPLYAPKKQPQMFSHLTSHLNIVSIDIFLSFTL